MTDREFRRLTREDLLDIIYELQQKTQRLERNHPQTAVGPDREAGKRGLDRRGGAGAERGV